MAPEDLMKGLILTALQDDDVQNLFKSLMEQCRDYEEVEGITSSSYRDTVLEQIAGSVSSFLLNKSNNETPGGNTGGCLHDSKVSCGELGEPATPHQVESSHDTNSSTNNTNPTPQNNHTSPVNLQQNVANITVGSFEESTNNTHASSQAVPDIKRSSSNEEDNLCGKILVSLKTQTDEETMLCNSEPHEVHYDQTGYESEEEFATLKTHDELPQTPYVYFLKANGYNEGDPAKMASYISDLSHIETAAQVNREHDVWDSGLTNKTKMHILSGFQKAKQKDDPCLKLTKEDKDGEDDSSDEDYQSMADQIDETDRLNLDSDHGVEHQSSSDNDDLETCYSSEGINLSRTSSAGFITAANSIEELQTESTQETREDKIIRPQFLGNLFETKLANARETAAQLKTRKPEPRVKIEKPVHLDTDLMFSVRQSLKRSLPKVAGKNNLSALMLMADGMFQEMSLDRGLDELAWPYDPLAELKESGLALVDYMEPTPSVPTAEKRPTHINSWEGKSVRVPSKLSLPLIFSRNVNCSEKQDTPTEKFNLAVSTTSQIVPDGRRSITMDHIKPVGGINRFSELFGQFLRMPRIPVMILQSALNPFKRGITHPQVTDNAIDGETVSEAVVPFYRKTSQPLYTEGARSQSLPKISTNYQLIPIEINKEAHMERYITRNIRPQFLGKFYQKNIIDALQTTAENKARTSWPKVKLRNPVQSYTVCQSLMRSLPKTTGKKNLSALMTLANEMFEEMSLDRQIYSDFDPLVELTSSDLSVDYMRPSRALLGPSTDLDETPSSQAVSGSESKWFTTQCSIDIQDQHAGYQNKGLDSPSSENPDEEATLSSNDCLPGSQEVVSTEEDMQDIETQKTAKIVQDDVLEDALTLHSPNEMNDPTECHREEHGPETASHKDEDNLSEDSALGEDRSTASLPEDDESIDSQTADSTFSSNHFEQFDKQCDSDIDDVGTSPIIQLPNRSRKMEEKVSQFVKCDPCDDSDNSVVDRNVSPDMKSRIDMFEAFQKPYTST